VEGGAGPLHSRPPALGSLQAQQAAAAAQAALLPIVPGGGGLRSATDSPNSQHSSRHQNCARPARQIARNSASPQPRALVTPPQHFGQRGNKANSGGGGGSYTEPRPRGGGAQLRLELSGGGGGGGGSGSESARERSRGGGGGGGGRSSPMQMQPVRPHRPRSAATARSDASYSCFSRIQA
jgi:hypothetical protein